MKNSLLLALLVLLAGLGIYFATAGGGDPPPAPANQPPGPTGPPVQEPTPAPPAPARPADVRVVSDPDRQVAQPPANQDECEQGVRGQVVDGRGWAVAAAQVVLQEAAAEDLLAQLKRVQSNIPAPPAATAVTDANGTFTLGLRQPTERRFEVFVHAEGFADQRLDNLRMLPGKWVELGQVVLEIGCAVSGTILIAGTQNPVPQAVVELDTANPLVDSVQQDTLRRRNLFAAADASGRYQLLHAPRGHPHSTFRMTAVAPGFARLIKSDIKLAADEPNVVNFELHPGLAIAGYLVAADGRPIPRTQIECWPQAREPAFQGSIDADGRFQVIGLREGPHRLYVRAEGCQLIDMQNVAAGTLDLRLQLEPRGSASVVVRTPDGRVLRNYRLAVRQVFPDNGGEIGQVRDVPDRTVRLQPNEQAAVVSGLEPSSPDPQAAKISYAFHVEAEGFARTLSPPFVLFASAAPPVVELTMTLGGSWQGLVTDEAGRPIAGATVATQPAGATEDNPIWRMLASFVPDRITRTSATTGSDGTFRLERLAHAPYQLKVAHPDYCQRTQRDLRVDSDDPATLPPIALVRGTLVHGRAFLDGAPAGQLAVVLMPAAVPAGDGTARPLDETALVRVEAVSDNEGRYVLPSRVPPGTYELRAHVQLAKRPDDFFLQMRQMQQTAIQLVVTGAQQTIEQDIRITAPTEPR